MKKYLFLFLLTISYLTNAQKTNSLSVRFENFVGDLPVSLHNANYKNAAGEDFNITLLQYFVSNIQLIKSDGSVFTVPQDDSYFLIKEAETKTKTITLKDIPNGKYTGIKFVIGVDSARNAADIAYRKGCLDVANEAKSMYWAWNSGYIFVKMEGTSPQSTEENNIFLYHIGLFGGIGDKKTLNNIKAAQVDFGKNILKLKSGKEAPTVVIKTDVSKIMNGSTTVSIAQNPSVMAGPYSAKIANNYQSMFSFEGFSQKTTTPVTLGMN